MWPEKTGLFSYLLTEGMDLNGGHVGRISTQTKTNNLRFGGGYGVRFPRLTFPAAKPVRSSALSQFTAPQSQLEGKGEELRASGF